MITTGPDNNLWFTENFGNKIGRYVPSTGTFTEYSLPTSNSFPFVITPGTDGNLWFTEEAGRVGRITTTGTISEFQPPSSSVLKYITTGPDGDLWFAENTANRIGKLYVLSATGTSLSETAGQPFTDVIATFHDDQPGMVAANYTAQIDWGDGSSLSTGNVSSNGNGTWNVTASHTYTNAGTYQTTITITDTHPGGLTATTTGSVSVNPSGGGLSGGGNAPSTASSGPSAHPRSVPTLPLPGVAHAHPVAPAAESVFSSPGVIPSAVLTPSAALPSHDAVVLTPNVSTAFRPPTAGTDLWGPLDQPDPAWGYTKAFLPEPDPLLAKDVLFAWLGGLSDPVDLRDSTWDDPATL
jgi:hypothetical protein